MKKIKGFGGRSYGSSKGESKEVNLESLQRIQQEMAKKMEKLEESFSQMEIVSTAGGGAIRVRATCDYRIVSIEYDDDLLNDKEMLNDLIIAAVNEVLQEIKKRRDEEMLKLTQGTIGL